MAEQTAGACTRGSGMLTAHRILDKRCRSGENAPQVLDHQELINTSGLESGLRLTCILAKNDKGKTLLSARSQALLPNTHLNLCSLTTQQANLFNTHWSQHVQITNGKLKTKPFRREPP